MIAVLPTICTYFLPFQIIMQILPWCLFTFLPMVPIQFQSSVLASVVFWVLAVFSTFSQDSDFLAGVFNHLWYLSIGNDFLAFMKPWKILLPLLMRMKSGLVFNTSFAVILKMRIKLICYYGKFMKKWINCKIHFPFNHIFRLIIGICQGYFSEGWERI